MVQSLGSMYLFGLVSPFLVSFLSGFFLIPSGAGITKVLQQNQNSERRPLEGTIPFQMTENFKSNIDLYYVCNQGKLAWDLTFILDVWHYRCSGNWWWYFLKTTYTTWVWGISTGDPVWEKHPLPVPCIELSHTGMAEGIWQLLSYFERNPKSGLFRLCKTYPD